MSISRRYFIAISLLALAIAASGVVYWLKAPYGFALQRQIATEFISHIHQNEFEAAFELTQKNGYTGETLEQFTDKMTREIRGSGYQFAYSDPTQTNGNRIRRWLRGSEVEMNDVSIELRGPSDLRITLRYLGNQQWKIFFVTSHAG